MSLIKSLRRPSSSSLIPRLNREASINPSRGHELPSLFQMGVNERDATYRQPKTLVL